jgi:hypothetical protein
MEQQPELIDVRPNITNDGIGRLLEMRADSKLVAHGPTAYKESSFLPCELSNMCLKCNRRWLVVDVVTD